MSNKANWESKLNKAALSFLKILVGKLTSGRIQVIHQGWWREAVDGEYCFKITWKDLSE